MGKFGWSYPPGAENDPYAPYNDDGSRAVEPFAVDDGYGSLESIDLRQAIELAKKGETIFRIRRVTLDDLEKIAEDPDDTPVPFETDTGDYPEGDECPNCGEIRTACACAKP